MQSRYIPLLSDLYEFRHRTRPVVELNFPENELLSPFYEFNIHLWGGYLYLFNNTSAIITSPDNRQEIHRNGGMLYKRTGKYSLRYVDMRRRHDILAGIQAESKDKWPVMLSLEIDWCVVDPLQVSKSKQPYQTLRNLCSAEASSFIRSKPLATLVPMPDGKAMEDAEINRILLGMLKANPVLSCFRFDSVRVRERSGGRQLSEKVQEARIQQTETQQALLSQIETLKLQLQKTQQELSLAKEREPLLVQEARSKRLSLEEESRVVISQAEFNAKAQDILAAARLRAIRLKQLSASQQLRHEEVIEAMKVFRDAFAMFAQAQLSPGWQPGLDMSKAFENLERAFDTLANFSVSETSGYPSNESALDVLPPVNIKHLD